MLRQVWFKRRVILTQEAQGSWNYSQSRDSMLQRMSFDSEMDKPLDGGGGKAVPSLTPIPTLSTIERF